MSSSTTDTKLLAFYEIARLANLNDHPDLVKSPSFQSAKELFEKREPYLREVFGNSGTPDKYFKMRLESHLTEQGASWESVWAEYAPESLKTFPLPPGSL
jgi:hypothetical protein